MRATDQPRPKSGLRGLSCPGRASKPEKTTATDNIPIRASIYCTNLTPCITHPLLYPYQDPLRSLLPSPPPGSAPRLPTRTSSHCGVPVLPSSCPSVCWLVNTSLRTRLSVRGQELGLGRSLVHPSAWHLEPSLAHCQQLMFPGHLARARHCSKQFLYSKSLQHLLEAVPTAVAISLMRKLRRREVKPPGITQQMSGRSLDLNPGSPAPEPPLTTVPSIK